MSTAVVLVILIPAALGRLALAAARPLSAGRRVNLAEACGHSWLLGCATISTTLLLLGRCGAPLSAGSMLAAVLAVAAILAAIAWAAIAWPRSGQGGAGVPPAHAGSMGVPPAHEGSMGVPPAYEGSVGVPPAHAGSMGVPPAHTGSVGVPPAYAGSVGVPPAHAGSMGVPPAYEGSVGVPPAHMGSVGVPPAYEGSVGVPPAHRSEDTGWKPVPQSSEAAPQSSGPAPQSAWPVPQILCAALLALIALHAAWIAADAHVAPELFNDAYENWLLRAKVIAERGRLPLDPADPFFLGGGRIGYPLGMPMLAVFAARLTGAWDVGVVGVFWPVYWMALLAVAGGWLARRCGPLTGCAAAYVLSSLPLPALHAARAGYADLLLAAHLTAACLAIWDWGAADRVAGDRVAGNRAIGNRAASGAFGRGGLAVVAAVNLLFCVLLKREGLAYAGLVLAPVVLIEFVRLARSMSLYADSAGPGARSAAGVSFASEAARLATYAVLFGAAAVGLAALSDLSFVARESRGLGFHPQALRAMGVRLFAWDSWGLLWWLLAPALAWATWRLARGGMRRDGLDSGGLGLATAHAWLLIAFVVAVFLFTDNWLFAVNGWTFDRTVMQVAPTLVCAAASALRPLNPHCSTL